GIRDFHVTGVQTCALPILLQQPPDAMAILALAHGAGTDMRHASMQALADALATAGIATLRYNFPYKEHGRGRPDSPEVATATVRDRKSVVEEKRVGRGRMR